MKKNNDFIDFAECNLSLLKPFIDFNSIINEYLAQNPLAKTDDEKEDIERSYKITQFKELNYRLKLYGFTQELIPENGYNYLIVPKESLTIKRYLHRFLTYKNLTGGEIKDGSHELFERISANAVNSFLNGGVLPIMVGEKQQQLTSERLEEIRALIKEPKGSYDELPPKAKDDGVDFISYKPIDERNIGNIIILGQACVGKNFKKKRQMTKRWLERYFHYYVCPPLVVYSVVSFLEKDEELTYFTSHFNNAIIFDRGRIMKYYDFASDKQLNQDIINFVEKKIDEQ